MTAAMTGWRDLAACRTVDPELFFPSTGADSAATQIEEAKRVCAACPVREACRDWALRQRERYGIYGGMTENERRADASAAPRTSALCRSGRHLKTGPGRCGACATDYQRGREQGRTRDQADVYARRAARAREEKGLAA
jgi:WhiB family transcriptional regulator, redox-sensing transcriptional regulator